MTLGFSEDTHSLYVYLSTTDRQRQMQILASGLTVWFDSTGSDAKLTGVRFTVGGADLGPPMLDPMNQEDMTLMRQLVLWGGGEWSSLDGPRIKGERSFSF